MKTIKFTFVAVLLAIFAAAALSIRAQDKPVSDKEISGEEKIKLMPKAAPPPAKKAAVKKKIKKPAPKPVSEYKFDKIEQIPAYTFDKQTNPIIKGAKPVQKPAAKPGTVKKPLPVVIKKDQAGKPGAKSAAEEAEMEDVPQDEDQE
jgi:hypothetical protein